MPHSDSASAPSSDATSMNHALITQVRDDIQTRINCDELVLPTLPEIALQVREVAEDERATVPQLAAILARDPAMSARLVRVSNSPMVRSAVPITDVITAVSRMGIDFTANLAIGIAMEQMFQATSDAVDRRLRACWSHSLEVASTAQVLARHFTSLPPDQALLAGLVHQIGILPLLAYAEDNNELITDAATLDLVIQKLHQPLGSLVLRHWEFPAHLVQVTKEYLTFNRAPDAADLTDLIQVATLQSYADTQHPLANINSADVPAFARLGLEVDDDDHQLEAIQEEQQETFAALNNH